MKEKKRHNVFVNGPITSDFIANSIAKHSTKTDIGAHDIFLGQVRSDIIDDKTVVAINYEASQELAGELFHEIREAAFAKYNLVCMHIYHSLGVVKVGEICLFVFVSSKHRKVAFEACQDIVEQIKAMTPIWGKEIFEDDSYVWKENQI